MRWKIVRTCCCARPGSSASWAQRRKVDFTEAPVVIAHPAAIVLALLMLRAQKVGKIARAIATLFEPASEHGRRGMDELHEQTVNLLSFQQLPKGVFDTQVAFNLLDRYGEKSLPTLASVESRIRAPLPRHCAGQAERTFADAAASSHLPRTCVFALH